MTTSRQGDRAAGPKVEILLHLTIAALSPVAPILFLQDWPWPFVGVAISWALMILHAVFLRVDGVLSDTYSQSRLIELSGMAKWPARQIVAMRMLLFTLSGIALIVCIIYTQITGGFS